MVINNTIDSVCKVWQIATAKAMQKLGAIIARSCLPGTVIYLYGDLGAGKTTLVRGFLHAFGHVGHVRSPTFTLFELYQVAPQQIICHLDLYRLKQSEELIYLGIRDYFNEKNICLIEWPDNGQGFLPCADLVCNFAYGEHQQVRIVKVSGFSQRGEQIIANLEKKK